MRACVFAVAYLLKYDNELQTHELSRRDEQVGKLISNQPSFIVCGARGTARTAQIRSTVDSVDFHPGTWWTRWTWRAWPRADAQQRQKRPTGAPNATANVRESFAEPPLSLLPVAWCLVLLISCVGSRAWEGQAIG